MKLEPAKNRILAASLNLGTYVYDNTILSLEKILLMPLSINRIPEFKEDATLQLGSRHISLAYS